MSTETVEMPGTADIAAPRSYTLAEHVLAMTRPAILVLIPIYCLGLIPATSVLAWLSTRADHVLGLPSLGLWIPWSVRLGVFLACLVIGGAWVGFTYTWLVLEGEGGPVPPFSSTTSRLVTSGPYALVRHPSIWGKTLGVLGLGILVCSPVFLFVVIPLLFTFSQVFTLRRQDVHMIEVFGDEYRRYAEKTPGLLPRLPWSSKT